MKELSISIRFILLPLAFIPWAIWPPLNSVAFLQVTIQFSFVYCSCLRANNKLLNWIDYSLKIFCFCRLSRFISFLLKKSMFSSTWFFEIKFCVGWILINYIHFLSFSNHIKLLSCLLYFLRLFGEIDFISFLFHRKEFFSSDVFSPSGLYYNNLFQICW